jgi:hypothetical protein
MPLVGFSRMVRRVAFVLISAAVAVALTPVDGRAEPDADRQLANAWQELEIVIERFNAARDEVRALDARRVAIERELGPLRQAVDVAQQRAGEMASALYRGGQIGSIGALLGAPSPETLIDQLAVLDHLERSR